MTEPSEFALLELATAYALHALSEGEQADIDRRIAHAPPSVAEAFDREVRAVRETMAAVSVVTASEPPARLRAMVLAIPKPEASGRRRWRTTILAAAAALVVGLGAFGVGIALRPSTTPTIAEQVLAAPDVRTVSRPIPTGGTVTVMFSRDRNAGVLVMNNVARPPPGTVYQMWLLSGDKAASAGTMDARAVTPSMTAMIPDLGGSSALGFSVEPANGSPQPAGTIFAELPLS